MKHKVQPNVIISLQESGTTTHYLIHDDLGKIDDHALLELGLEEIALSMQSPVVQAIMDLNGDGEAHTFTLVTPRGHEMHYELLSVSTLDEFKSIHQGKQRILKK